MFCIPEALSTDTARDFSHISFTQLSHCFSCNKTCQLIHVNYAFIMQKDNRIALLHAKNFYAIIFL